MIQTDELMGYVQQAQEPNMGPTAEQLGDAKERLRLLENLKEHKGYQLFLQAILNESRHCLLSMDKSNNPTDFTKYAANHYSLTMVAEWLEVECAKLRALLATAVR